MGIKIWNKKAQFYFVATIVVIAMVVGIASTFNYSKKSDFSSADEIAKELQIESERVLDYDLVHSSNSFEEFSRDYSEYVGEDKEIYFIRVNETSREAYKYINGVKNDFSYFLEVGAETIYFSIEGEVYSFKLERGENFYFVLIYNRNGERYIFSG